MNYNKEKFLNILNKLKESFGSQNKMAEALGISSSYITKIYDKNTKKPPAPEYLKRIADNSKGITTYRELMIICGYITFESEDKKNIELNLINKTKELQQKQKKSNLSNDEKLIINDYLMKVIKQIKEKDSDNPESIIKILTKTLAPLYDNKKLYLCCMREFYLLYYTASEELYFISDLQKYNNEIQDDNAQTYKRIPVLGSIPAGIPIELIEDILDYEDISENMLKGGKEYFALKVKGSSMWPKYLDGDTIIVLKQDDCESGQDAVVMVNGNDGTFKRVIKKDNGITLEPINQQEYNSVSYSNEDIEKLPVKILGVVKEIRRKI